jgi:hypothetical protein
MKEVFKPVKGFKGYHISSRGYIVVEKSGRVLKPEIRKLQLYVSMNGTVRSLSKLMIKHFKNATNKDYAIHLDYNTFHNVEENLDKVNSRSKLYQHRKNKENKNRCVFPNTWYNRGKSQNKWRGKLNIKGTSFDIGYFKTKKAAEEACAKVFKRKMGFEMKRIYSKGN